MSPPLDLFVCLFSCQRRVRELPQKKYYNKCCRVHIDKLLDFSDISPDLIFSPVTLPAEGAAVVDVFVNNNRSNGHTPPSIIFLGLYRLYFHFVACLYSPPLLGVIMNKLRSSHFFRTTISLSLTHTHTLTHTHSLSLTHTHTLPLGSLPSFSSLPTLTQTKKNGISTLDPVLSYGRSCEPDTRCHF
jgi:hypothetical protein